MAIAIIGGTITATMLTLLVVPSFYDSIEIAHDRMLAKFRLRSAQRPAFVAFLLTFGEALVTLLTLRWFYRNARRLLGRGGVTPVVTNPQ